MIRTAPPGARPISQVLEQARSRLDRLGPAQAWAAMQAGAESTFRARAAGQPRRPAQ